MSKKTEKEWRKHWFVSNVLSEIPLLGGFFHSEDPGHALHHAVKYLLMVFGGYIGMMIAPMQHGMMALQMIISIIFMGLGMSFATIVYNICLALLKLFVSLCQTDDSTEKRSDLLESPLIQE